MSGHDKKIKDDYSGFLSDTCLREYQELEYYFCLGCHPSQVRAPHVVHSLLCVSKVAKIE